MRSLKWWLAVVVCLTLAMVSGSRAEWTKAGLPDGGPVRSFAVVGTDLFAVTSAGLYRTSDYGAHWVATGPSDRVINSICAYADRLFAATGTGLMVSSDLGATWSWRATSVNVNRVSVSDGRVWAVTWENSATRLYFSADSGDHWGSFSVSPGIYNGDVAAYGNHLFLANYQGVFTAERLETGYSTWYSIWQGDVRSIIATDTAIYAASTDGPQPVCKWGVLISRDFGTFQSSGQNGLTCLDITAVYLDGSTLYAGTQQGVFRSTDGGGNWTDLGLNYATINAIARVGTALFVGTNGGVDISVDDGATWSPVNTGLRGSTFNNISLIGSDLMLATSSGIFRTSDIGETWAGVGCANHSVNVIESDNTTVYAGATDGVWRSIDNGSTWTNLPTTGMNDWDRDIQSILVTQLGTIMSGSINGTNYRSIDGGLTWTVMGIAGSVFAMLSTETCVLAGTYGRIYRSVNDGLNWTRVADDPYAPYSAQFHAFARRGNDIYAAGYGGVSVSSDDGQTWAPMRSGLTDPIIWNLLIYGTNLYAMTRSGVFVLPQGSSTWFPANGDGLVDNDVFRIAAVGSDLVAITMGPQNEYKPAREIWNRPASELNCCQGTYGNINQMGVVDLSDLSYLVSYLTGSGTELPCLLAANVSGSGIVDLTDMSALVSYLTGGGYVLPNCP